MSITDTFNISASGSDGTRITGSSIEVGTTRVAVNTALPASSTNTPVAAAWTVADTQSLILLSTSDCTIKTNSSGSPADTIDLKAGIPLIWRASAGYDANPFTVDVTSWFVTCTAAAQLSASILTT